TVTERRTVPPVEGNGRDCVNKTSASSSFYKYIIKNKIPKNQKTALFISPNTKTPNTTCGYLYVRNCCAPSTFCFAAGHVASIWSYHRATLGYDATGNRNAHAVAMVANMLISATVIVGPATNSHSPRNVSSRVTARSNARRLPSSAGAPPNTWGW
uniref:Uncharacterized protein n=1 Tax=Anopheles atroparvus TaxID=41427 RepID=A0AAG5CP63_ANOAO